MRSSHLILGIVFLATMTRIAIPSFIGHPPNFSPIDAIALFCGVHFSRRSVSIAVTLLSVWIGDILINSFAAGQLSLFYPGFYWQYLSYALIALLGSVLITEITFGRVALASLTSACLFFVMSNFAVWFSGLLYPFTVDGLVECYIAAIPFFKNTFMSDFVFASVLFCIPVLIPRLDRGVQSNNI